MNYLLGLLALSVVMLPNFSYADVFTPSAKLSDYEVLKKDIREAQDKQALVNAQFDAVERIFRDQLALAERYNTVIEKAEAFNKGQADSERKWEAYKFFSARENVFLEVNMIGANQGVFTFHTKEMMNDLRPSLEMTEFLVISRYGMRPFSVMTDLYNFPELYKLGIERGLKIIKEYDAKFDAIFSKYPSYHKSRWGYSAHRSIYTFVDLLSGVWSENVKTSTNALHNLIEIEKVLKSKVCLDKIETVRKFVIRDCTSDAIFFGSNGKKTSEVIASLMKDPAFKKNYETFVKPQIFKCGAVYRN